MRRAGIDGVSPLRRKVFTADYPADPALRREIHEGLQVVETWNSANNALFYGKEGL